MSADPELGLVYIPTNGPTIDYYGGFHPGDNLYGTSLIALDVETGERKWHYQMVHHDIWNYDTPTAPVLMDVTVEGKVVKGIFQATKQSFVYALNRATGKPIWPIEELPVPAGDVPGEWYSPTQPFPTRPAAFDRQGFTENDLIDFTPELRLEALESIVDFRLSPSVYSPPSLMDAEDGTRGTLGLPSATGGANWEGSALDPETGILYIPSRTQLAVLTLGKDENSDVAFSQSFGVRIPRVQGLEIVKPPYGRITAIDMNSGDHLWQIANADTPDNIANHPALEGIDIPRTGVPTRAGIVLTKTLLFAGEGGGGPGASPILRAIDKQTGEIVAEIELPNNQSGLPFTYEHEGKQYVAMFVGGGGNPAELVAYALP